MRTNPRPEPWTGVHGGYPLTDEYPVKKLKVYVDRLTVGEGTQNVQRILIAEAALGLKDANRHPVRNRARGDAGVKFV